MDKAMLERFNQLSRQQRLALINSAGCLLIGLIIAVASLQSLQQHNRTLTDQWGETLAQQLALATNDAVIQNDRVSLQAQLKSIAEQEGVNYAAVFTIDNQLLAASGKSQGEADYSAPITLQDSIAGYVVIGLNSNRQQWQTSVWQLLLLILLLCALVFLITLKAPNWWQQADRHHPPSDGSGTRLSLRLYPRQRLQGSDLDALSQIVNTLCRLYEGQLLDSSGDGLTLQFPAGDGDDAHPFRATCSAHLLIEWLGESDCRLQGGIGVALADEMNLSATLANRSDNSVLISDRCAEHPGMTSRVYMVAAKQGQQLTGFSSRYQNLLDNQLSTLLRDDGTLV